MTNSSSSSLKKGAGEEKEEDRDAKKPRLMMMEDEVGGRQPEEVGGDDGGGDNNNNNDDDDELGKEEEEGGHQKSPAKKVDEKKSSSTGEDVKEGEEGGKEERREEVNEEDLAGGGGGDGGDKKDEKDDNNVDTNNLSREEILALYEQERRMNEEKDKVIEGKDKVIEGKDKVIEEKDKVIEEKDKVIGREKAHVSLKSILDNIPTIKPNPQRKPAIVSNEKLQQLVTTYRRNYKRYSEEMKAWKASGNQKHKLEKPEMPSPPNFHLPSKVNHRQLQPELFNFSHVTEDEKGMSIRSVIAIKAENLFERDPVTQKKCFSHHNETSPQTLLDDALVDIQRTLRLASPELEVVKEFSLFSLRPDLIVITRYGRIVLIVEVKNPSKLSVVFANDSAAGQVLDYLKVMLQQGTKVPIVLLSTYNETSIATFPNQAEEVMVNFRNGTESLQKLYNDPKSRKSDQKTNKLPYSPWREGLYIKLDVIDQRRARSQSVPDLEPEVDDEITEVSETDESGGFNYDGREILR